MSTVLKYPLPGRRHIPLLARSLTHIPNLAAHIFSMAGVLRWSQVLLPRHTERRRHTIISKTLHGNPTSDGSLGEIHLAAGAPRGGSRTLFGAAPILGSGDLEPGVFCRHRPAGAWQAILVRRDPHTAGSAPAQPSRSDARLGRRGLDASRQPSHLLSHEQAGWQRRSGLPHPSHD